MRTREVVALFFRDLRWILLALALPLAAALALYAAAPKRYAAEAKLLVGVRDPQARLLPDGDFGGPQATAIEVINSEVEVLTSEDLARRTLRAMASPAPRGVSAAPFQPNAAAAQAAEGRGTAAAAGPDAEPSGAAVQAFERSLQVRAVPASHVIEIRYEAVSPIVAATTLGVLLNAYRQVHEAAGSGEVGGLVKEQLGALEADAEGAEREIGALKAGAGVFDPEQEKKNLLDNRSALAAAAMQLRAHAAELKARISSLGVVRRTTPAAIAQYPTSDELEASAKARAQLLELRQQEVKLRENYQPGTRALRDLDAQIDGVQRFLQGESERFAAKTKPSRNPLYDELTADGARDAAQVGPDERHAEALDQEIAGLDARLRTLSVVEDRLQPLLRRRASDAAALEALRQRQAAALLGEGSRASPGAVSVIEAPSADPGARPVKPKLLTFLLGGLVAGGALAGAVLAAGFARKNSFLVPEAVEAYAGVPVLVSLPVRPS